MNAVYNIYCKYYRDCVWVWQCRKLLIYSVSSGNTLYYGDNLTVMKSMPAECVDLIYLDPPFNSKRTYNLLYRNATGLPVPEQPDAFCDTWELDAEKLSMVTKMPTVLREYGMDDEIVRFWQTWMNALKNTQPKLLAYLIYMFYRLLEMRRLLAQTGSIYLHCDPTASHYIKILMDGVFGHDNFRNEIIWHYQTGGASKRWYSKKHDTIFFYSKSNNYYINLENIRVDRSEKSLQRAQYRKGARIGITDTTKLPSDVFIDINALNPMATERLGYPTQKPVALLDRLIKGGCPPDGIIFDPFCGCGTSIYSAIDNKKQWIGCDIAILSVKLIQEVLEKRYSLREKEDYIIDGIPVSEEQARELFNRDPFQFQHWAVELAGGFCNLKKTTDKGIDGAIYYETTNEKGQRDLKKVIVSVKGGRLRPTDIRDLHGTLGANIDAEMAAFVCLEQPTKAMKETAAAAGTFEYQGVTYDRLQIRTIAELLDNRPFDTPTKVRLIHKEKQYGLAI